jgi:hypothetical protein
VWLLMPAVLPVAAALTTAWLADRLRLAAWAGRAAAVALLALMAVDEHRHQNFVPARCHSLADYVGSNAVYAELARRAATEPRFRVHDFERTAAYLEKTPELFRSTLRLEGLETVLGIFSIPAYDKAWLAASVAQPARYWGAMNCRYVTSVSGELDVPGLTLVGSYPRRPGSIVFDGVYAGFDGPFLYRNDLALPRAALLDHAVLLIGGNGRDFMSRLDWPSQRCALVQLRAERAARLDDALLARFDAVLSFAEGADPALDARLAALGERHRRDDGDLQASLDWVAAAWSRARTPMQPLDDPPRTFNGVRVELPEAAGDPPRAPGGRWLLLAETCSIYPGWSATVDGRRVPILRANGVTTAIALPEGARRVELRYEPPGLRTGMALTGAGALLGLALLWARRRST